MTMFNITDGNNNVSRDKPVEHIDMVIGLHVSACTSRTRTMRVRRDIAIDITESVQLLVRFNALRSMPVMPKLEHYNQNAMRSMAAAALATQAAAANARARPRLAGQCEKWLARPNPQRDKPALGRPPPSPCPHTRPHSCPHKRPHARPHSRTRGLVPLRKCPLVYIPGTPAVGAVAASCQVHEMGVGGLLLRLAWQRPASGWCYIGSDRRCLGRLAW